MNAWTPETPDLLSVSDYEDAAGIPAHKRLTEIFAARISLKPDVQKDVFKATANRYKHYLYFCDAVDEVASLITPPRPPYSGNHLMISPHTEGTLSDLGAVDRPVTMTVNHAWLAMQPGPWEGGEYHQHGIPSETLKRLPWLLERPALVANSKDDRTKLVLALAATDDRGMPLIASVKIDALGRIDMDRFISNLVCTVFGPEEFYDYFGLGLKPRDIVYIDSESEEALREITGKEVFGHLRNLSRDIQLAAPQIVGDPEYNPYPTHDSRWLSEAVAERDYDEAEI